MKELKTESMEGKDIAPDTIDGLDELSHLKKMFAQTNKDVSLYCLLDHFKELALQEEVEKDLF